MSVMASARCVMVSVCECVTYTGRRLIAVNKAQQLLQGLQAAGDEGAQLTAVIEMCQVSNKFTSAKLGMCWIFKIFSVIDEFIYFTHNG